MSRGGGRLGGGADQDRGDLLGDRARASFLGEPERNTAKMLEEAINKAGGLLGRPVEVIVYDDETDATKAVTAFDRLVKKDQVVAVIGPSHDGQHARHRAQGRGGGDPAHLLRGGEEDRRSA